MIALIQRVSFARIRVEENTIADIGKGLLALIGIQKDDNDESAKKMIRRLLHYRVFSDSDGRMNQSLLDTAGELLLVSQFTLAADTDQGLRPGFSKAMPPESARVLFDHLVAHGKSKYEKVQNGRFGADMQIELLNDGPVTFNLRV